MKGATLKWGRGHTKCMLYTLNTVLHCKLCEMEAVSMRVRATLVIYSLTGLFWFMGLGRPPQMGALETSSVAHLTINVLGNGGNSNGNFTKQNLV